MGCRCAGALVAEYRYDGLGQRVAWHGDFDADGTLESTSDDPWYVFVCDDQWRVVGTYRAPTWGGTLDSSPKETFLHHAAGVDGRGSSSYLDSVILRERDNTNGWRGAADGTLEERRFYGQNWRADVALVMKTTGRPLERIKYSAYGVATLKPGYDYNGDGVIDADDLGDIITDAASPTPPASADWNLDGTPNTTDSSEYTSDYYALTSTGWAYGDLTLADTGNRKGYAGYEHDDFTGQYHVRHRVYEPQLGRWTKRDPLGYVDGVSVYEYVRGRAISLRDASGLGSFYNNYLGPTACNGAALAYDTALVRHGATIVTCIAAGSAGIFTIVTIPAGVIVVVTCTAALAASKAALVAACVALQLCEFTGLGRIITQCDNGGIWPIGFIPPRPPPPPPPPPPEPFDQVDPHRWGMLDCHPDDPNRLDCLW